MADNSENSGMKPQDEQFFDKAQRKENRIRQNYYAYQRDLRAKAKQERKQ
jgi:hypothetical protein